MLLSIFNIADFASFFELLVAFTFAYTGIDSFQKYINTKSIKKSYNLEEIKKRIDEAEDGLKGFGNDKSAQHFKNTKIIPSQEALAEMREILDNANDFRKGVVFKPIFYLTGVIYLSVLILCGFESGMPHRVKFSIILFFVLFFLVYFVLIFWILHLRSKQMKPPEFLKKFIPFMSGRKIIKRFVFWSCWVYAAIIFLWVLNEYYPIDPLFIRYCNNNSCFGVPYAGYIQILAIISLLGISILPYALFYKREPLFLSGYYKEMDKLDEEIKKHLADVTNFKESHKKETDNLLENDS